MEKVILLALDMGGTITGEHGVGVHKTRFVHYQYGPEERDVMLAVKKAFDPKGLINPMIFPVTGHEPRPARRAAMEGRVAADGSFEQHMDNCLGCRACEDVCPSAVPYDI